MNMKKLAIIYTTIFLGLWVWNSTHYNVMFEFDDLFKSENFLPAFGIAGGLFALNWAIMKKKLILIYSVLFLGCFVILCCLGGGNISGYLELLKGTFYIVSTIGVFHLVVAMIYSMTPRGTRALEQSLEKSLGGLPFVHLSGLEQFEVDSIVKIVIVDDKFVIKKSDLSKVQEFNLEDIKSIKPLSEDTVTEKEKSVISRAIVGGVIFGVTGAIVGGLSGIGSKKEIKTEHFIKITLNNGLELLFAPFMNNPENYKYLTRKLDEYILKTIGAN